MAAPVREVTAKQDTIVRAAAMLFNRYGYRKTSVDQIAREAEVAKPTLYAHFGDKEAIFVAVCRHVMDGIMAATAAAADHAEVVDRLAGMVSAKFTTIFALVGSSPHARELLEAQTAQARAVIAAADAAYLELLTAALRAALRRGELSAELVPERGRPARLAQLAQLLMQAGHGASYGARSADDHRASVRALVAAVLGRGLRATG